MSEEDETPEPDWAEITRQARYVEQQAPGTLRRLIEAARVAQAHLGPTMAAGEELARTMDEGIREVLEALRGFGGQPPLPTGTALLETATVGLHDVGAGVDSLTVMKITGTASISVKKPTLAAVGHVGSADQADELNRKLPGLTPGLILAVLLVLFAVGGLPVIEAQLPPEAHGFIGDEVADAGVLVPLAVLLWRHGRKGRDDRDR